MSGEEQLVPVVAYARISADLAKDGHGVQDQHKVNDATAAALSLKIVHYYTDNDLSAAKADLVRPDFEAMLKVLKAGHLPDGEMVRGAIVVADDRRSYAHVGGVHADGLQRLRQLRSGN